MRGPATPCAFAGDGDLYERMSESLATALLLALAAYLAAGLVFAIPFLTRGAGAIDADAREGSWGFKLAVLPGVCALWPILLGRWRGGTSRRPTPHERAAREAEA